MFERIKRILRSGAALPVCFLAVHLAVLAWSFGGIDPGFWPRTTFARLYEYPSINGLLALALLAGSARLTLTTGETHAADALAFAGFLWGIGAACAIAFDVGVFVAYLLAGMNLYRLNAPGARSPW